MTLLTTAAAEPANTIVPHWLIEKIQRTNYSLTDFMQIALSENAAMERVLAVSMPDMMIFRKHASPMAAIMNMPFVALAPVLDDARDWKSIVEGSRIPPRSTSSVLRCH